MEDPKKRRYIYLMLSGFGAISLSVILFFVLYRLQGIGQVLKDVRKILAPFIYGGVVAYLLRPMCNTYERFLEKHLPGGMKRLASGMAVFGSLLTALLLVYALVAMIVPRVLDSLVALGKMIPSKLESFLGWAEETFGDNETMDSVFAFFNTSYEKLYQTADAWVRKTLPQIATLVTSVGSSVYGVVLNLYNLVIGLIVAVYVLFSRKRFARQSTLIVRSVFSQRWADAILEEVSVMDRMFGGFIDAKILDSLIIGILCYLGCLILRMPNTLLISVFVGVTNIIPFFGPVIGAVPSVLLILIDSPIKAVWFVVFVIVLQQLDGNVIGPGIMGNRIGISGFWVMFAIIFFGGIWGLTGMIIGVPLFAVIYDLVRKFVKASLAKRGNMELWEKYVADFPNEDAPKPESGPQRGQWDWAEVRRGAKRFWGKTVGGLRIFWRWCCIAGAFLKKWAIAAWGWLKKAAAWCAVKLKGLKNRSK